MRPHAAGCCRGAAFKKTERERESQLGEAAAGSCYGSLLGADQASQVTVQVCINIHSFCWALLRIQIRNFFSIGSDLVVLNMSPQKNWKQHCFKFFSHTKTKVFEMRRKYRFISFLDRIWKMLGQNHVVELGWVTTCNSIFQGRILTKWEPIRNRACRNRLLYTLYKGCRCCKSSPQEWNNLQKKVCGNVVFCIHLKSKLLFCRVAGTFCYFLYQVQIFNEIFFAVIIEKYLFDCASCMENISW